MTRLRRSKYFDQFGNHRAGERAARNDRRQFPPQRSIAVQHRNNQIRDDVGEHNRNDRSQPHQRRQRRFKVHFAGVGVTGLGDRGVNEIRHRAGNQHHDAHHENPHQQLHLNPGIRDGQQDKGNQSDAGDAVGLKAVGAGSDRVARVVAGTVGNHAGIARVVFLDLEDDLHQVRTDVGNLGKDAARDSQGRGAQTLTDGKADKAGTGILAGHEQQNEEHDQQLDADQQHADAHAGLKRNRVDRKGLAFQTRERGARIRKRVDANSKPRHAITAGDADQTEKQNHRHGERHRMTRHRPQHSEVRDRAV